MHPKINGEHALTGPQSTQPRGPLHFSIVELQLSVRELSKMVLEMLQVELGLHTGPWKVLQTCKQSHFHEEERH